MDRKLLRVCATSAACAALLAASACGEGNESVPLSDTYELLSAAYEDGTDCTEDFLAFTAAFSGDGTVRVVINYLNILTTRNSAYTCDGEKIVETCDGREFVYEIEGDTLTTTYEEDIGVVLIKQDAEGRKNPPVDFESLLFGEDMSNSKFYNYCPAIVTEEENGEEVMHIWYCTNRDDGIIMDYVGYRKGVRQADGKWKFSEQSIALAPTPGTWDARHTCDPAVVRGSFRYRGETYGWLMAYLGCVTEDYGQNETGIAVANAPEGPWVKIEELNPLVPWKDVDGRNEQYGADGKLQFNWGTGMPTLVNLDGEGDILLTYQSGSRGTGVQRWNFADLDALIASGNAQPAFTATLTHRGVVNSQGASCRISIPDFAYDRETGRFYVCCVTNEKTPADVTLTRVNSHCLVACLEGIGSPEALAETLRSEDYTWRVLGYVGPEDTGFERNHNPAIVRDGYGRLPAKDREAEEIRVVVSTGHNNWANENIFTYRLHGKILKTSAGVSE